MSTAKELLRKTLSEADGPEGQQGQPPNRPPLKLTGRMRRIPLHQPGSEMGDEDMPDTADMPPDIARMTGRQSEPRGQFNPRELSQLKDVVILMLANALNSDMDKQLGEALMTGKEIDRGLLQHVLDEARSLNLPESHGALMQKIFRQLGQ